METCKNHKRKCLKKKNMEKLILYPLKGGDNLGFSFYFNSNFYSYNFINHKNRNY